MKTSIWDVLTGITLLAILCLILVFAVILINPSTPLNPLPPTRLSGEQMVPTVVLPSATMTSRGMPPTWTPVPTKADTPAPSSSGNTVLRPSSTPVPTNTVVVLPSFTPSKTYRPAIGGGSCTIVYQEPKDGTNMTKSKTFDVRWTIKNTSSQTWRGDSVDVKFISGDRMHSGNDLRDMPYDVAANGMLDLVVSMTAPATSGSYTSNWALVAGSSPLCNFYVQIRVP